MPSARYKCPFRPVEGDKIPLTCLGRRVLTMKAVDYYEFLQISPNAEEDTIHRVYRFLAARFHPDNPVSGDVGKFSMLTAAYSVLSDPAKRAAYDATRTASSPRVTPLSQSVDFMDSLEGEKNRRLAVLAVLYYRRRTSPFAPEVPLAEVETRLGFPREYLDFTTWYLQRKGYITKADNSDFTLTVQGVDFVETQRAEIPILDRLLTKGAEQVERVVMESNGHFPEAESLQQDGNHSERWSGARDRRTGQPDLRANPVERRVGTRKRKGSAADSPANP